ncbi:MAG: twin-arginine translocase subunit TatC [Candidatus Chloroheliales bacterium]|nr:MAG: twin-arginine translocase subunit TatC [Chloroflexota bacterium]
MPIMGHLTELRDRLIKIVLFIIAGAIISFIFINNLISIILQLVPKPGQGQRPISLIALQPTEVFVTYFQVALIAGIILAMPGVIYQILAFVTPGLTRQERRWLFTALPFVTIFFAAGVLFAYFVVLPSALNFLLFFGDPSIQGQYPIGTFFGFVTTFSLAIGLVFLLPVIIYILARLHIVNTRLLKKARRYVIVAAFIIAAIITPTPDPVNQTIVAVPMILLYEVGLFLTRFVH